MQNPQHIRYSRYRVVAIFGMRGSAGKGRGIAAVFRRAKEKTRNRHRCGLPLSSRSPALRHGFCERMMNANEFSVYMQCSIYSRQEKARWLVRSGLKSIPWGNGGDRCMVRQAATHVSQRMTEALVGLSLPGRIWCWYCCLPPAPEDAAGHGQEHA